MSNAPRSAAERIGDEFEKTKDNIGRAAAASGEELAAQLQRLSDDINAIKQTLGSLGKTSAAQAQDGAHRIGAAAAEAAGEAVGEAQRQVHSLAAEFEAVARRHPGAVLGGALGLGVLLGLLLRRH